MGSALSSSSAGWLLWEPSSDWAIGFADGSLLWTWRHAVAVGLAVLGPLVLAGLGG